MLSRFIYYLVVKPVSKLPMGILYGIGTFFIFVVVDVFGYRKKVVFENLKHSFPERSHQEITSLSRNFFNHFGQLLAEGVKAFSISEKELMQRYKVRNPEVVESLYAQGKSAILVAGHFNNWEFMVQSLNLQFSHQGVGVGKPITSEGFGKMMDDTRKRFGMQIWDASNVRERFKTAVESDMLFTCMLLADQSPSNPEKSFWMKFLRQDTPTLFGPEYLAKKYDVPVIYYEVIKVKRGFYELEFTPVSMSPTLEKYGDITYKHNKMLEATIRKKPEQWLWSHKRWKHAHRAVGQEIRS